MHNQLRHPLTSECTYSMEVGHFCGSQSVTQCVQTHEDRCTVMQWRSSAMVTNHTAHQFLNCSCGKTRVSELQACAPGCYCSARCIVGHRHMLNLPCVCAGKPHLHNLPFWLLPAPLRPDHLPGLPQGEENQVSLQGMHT